NPPGDLGGLRPSGGRAPQGQARPGRGVGVGAAQAGGGRPVIVRILTEGQYEITGDLLEELDREDNRLLEAIANSDEEAFRRELEMVLAIVRRGRRLADDELVERSEEHTSELQSRENLVCRLLLEKKNERSRTYVALSTQLLSHFLLYL